MAALRNARIRIEQNTDSTVDSHRDAVPSWSVFAVVWAAVLPISGSERFTDNQMASEVSHRIEMNYVAGVTTKMRIVWQTRVFDIQSVLNVDERNRDLVILASERT